MDVITPDVGHFKWNLCYAYESPNEHIEQATAEVVENDEVLTIDKVKEIAADSIRKVSEKDGYVSATYDLDYIVI